VGPVSFTRSSHLLMLTLTSYYVWDIEESNPIILVREEQFQTLIDHINVHHRLRLRINSHQRSEGLAGSFPDHPRCLPRYLGRSHSKQDIENMTANAPKASYGAAGEASHPPLEPPTLEEFKQVIEDMIEAQKSKSKATTARKQVERLDKNRSMMDQLKRAQRYLGLRPTVQDGQAPPSLSTAVDPSLPAPFAFDQSVVFVCVDVESHERAHHKITEVGVATLDTRDLVGVAPGENGAAWREKIRARHFRINEHRHLINSEFVTGYPDGFMFGESTFVPQNEAGKYVEACFQAPFGAHVSNGKKANLGVDPTEKRNIIFLGHDTSTDIRYLQELDFDPMKADNILEAMDTASMYKVWNRDQQPTSLGKILAKFDIVGWKLHNAGNDAVYTVQAMLGICVKEATMRGSPDLEELREKEKTARLEAALEEARQKVEADAEGWNDHEVNGDGGGPVPLVAAGMIPAKPLPKAMPQYDGASDYDNGRGRGRGRGGPTFDIPVRNVNQRGRGPQVSRGYRGSPERGGYRGSTRGQDEGRGRSRGRARGQTQGRGRGRGHSGSEAASSATAPQVCLLDLS
jgi:hypothetical protein